MHVCVERECQLLPCVWQASAAYMQIDRLPWFAVVERLEDSLTSLRAEHGGAARRLDAHMEDHKVHFIIYLCIYIYT